MNPTIPIPNHPNHPANHRNPDFPHSTPEAPSPAASSDTNSHPRRPAPLILDLPGAKCLQRIFITITILGPVLLATQLHAQTELLPAGSAWQWLNLIDATTGNQIDPGTLDPDFHTTWHTSANYDGPSFNGPDPALLGYGGINAGPLATDIGTPTSGTRFTTYFRTTFIPAQLVPGLRFEGLIDDGAIIYVNGHEVARINMNPDAADSYPLLAAGGGDETNFVTVDVAERMNLPAGVSVEIGVSLHNQSTASSDAGFDLRVLSTPGPPVEIDATVQYSVESDGPSKLLGFQGIETLQDVNGDGYDDFVTTGTDRSNNSNDSVQVFSGRDGTLLYSLPTTRLHNNSGQVLASLGDIDGDGDGDFVELGWGSLSATSVRRADFTIRSGTDGNVIRRSQVSTRLPEQPTIIGSADLDGDGVTDYGIELWLANSEWKGFAFSGANGDTVSDFQIGFETSGGRGGRLVGRVDANRDGEGDMILQQYWTSPSTRHELLAVSGPHRYGNLDVDSIDESRILWRVSTDYVGPNSFTRIGDITNDGVDDIAFG